jgi:hypothetical protein
MPRPIWDPTKPLDSDQVSSFPSLHRADKSTLKDVLGTLGPFGATTTAWRQVQIGDDTWLVQNLYFDGTNWNRDDTTKASVAIGLGSNGTVTVHKVAAGSNPVGVSLPDPIATLNATSLFSALVVGVDPGGTEALRAQDLRAGATTITGDLTAPTAVIGTDPGGTETLRAQTLRAGPTTIAADLTVTGNALQGARSDRGIIGFESDWNIYTDAGVYATEQRPGTPVNAPPSTYRYGILIVERFGNVGLTQIYIPHFTDPNIYVRQLWPNATWSEWRRISAPFV